MSSVTQADRSLVVLTPFFKRNWPEILSCQYFKIQLCSLALVERGQNIKEKEAWRSPGRWQAKQVVLCLAQHISLLFAAFIVMGWQTTMKMRLRLLQRASSEVLMELMLSLTSVALLVHQNTLQRANSMAGISFGVWVILYLVKH